VGAPFNPKQTSTTVTPAASEPAAASSSGSAGGVRSSGSAGGASSSRGAGSAGGTGSSNGGATSRLFENVKPPEGMAGAAGSAAGHAEAEALPGRGAGWGAWLGNTIFFSGVAASAFFGYYTYRYSSDQLDTMIQETEKSENAFPGSEVRDLRGGRALLCWQHARLYHAAFYVDHHSFSSSAVKGGNACHVAMISFPRQKEGDQAIRRLWQHC